VELLDAHAHTNVSYCASPDLTLAVYRAALDDPHTMLGRQAITNHGFQAYFPPDLAWSWEFLDTPALFDAFRARGDEVLLRVREEMEALHDDRFLFGVEVELMGDGRLTVSDAVRAEADLLVGSLHVMPQSYGRGESEEAAARAFLAYNRDLAASGVQVIAHPFRWFAESIGFVPPELVSKLIELAAERGVAVELNTHGVQRAQALLIAEAAAAGVPIALGTDAHTPDEVGRLEPHLELIRQAGFDPELISLYGGPGRGPS
jgi:histidinol phosphatase-like PHP family hydrolase